jgi:predicted enzyme related to lactoylglutathione lyase
MEATVDDWARPVVHFELAARDPEAIRRFYAEMFNWEIGDGALMTITPGIGGPEPGPGGHIRQSDNPGVSLYIQVRELAESLKRSVELGGTVIAEPFDVTGGPTLAFITDPEGNGVALVQQ